MVNGIWLKLGLVGLFGGRFMLKKFHGHWVYQTCTCFTMPLCCIQTLGISFGSLARQMVVQIGGDQSFDHMGLHKKSHWQWVKESGTSFTKLQSAPIDKWIFPEEKFNWTMECFWRNWLSMASAVYISTTTHIASTCFTMWPTDQKLKHDNSLTWVMGFGSNLVWWS